MIPLARPGDRPLSVVKAQLTPGLCGVGREAGSGAGLLLTRRGGIGHLVWPAVEILSVLISSGQISGSCSPQSAPLTLPLTRKRQGATGRCLCGGDEHLDPGDHATDHGECTADRLSSCENRSYSGRGQMPASFVVARVHRV